MYRPLEPAYEQEDDVRALDELKPFKDLVEYLKEYSRERPEMMALTCLGVGFVLGWKLKPW